MLASTLPLYRQGWQPEQGEGTQSIPEMFTQAGGATRGYGDFHCTGEGQHLYDGQQIQVGNKNPNFICSENVSSTSTPSS